MDLQVEAVVFHGPRHQIILEEEIQIILARIIEALEEAVEAEGRSLIVVEEVVAEIFGEITLLGGKKYQKKNKGQKFREIEFHEFLLPQPTYIICLVI